jgi:hypothetical protein
MAGKKLSAVYVSWPRPSFAHVVKTQKDYRQHYNAAMLYAHYELSSSDLKKEVFKYLKSLDVHHPLLEKIKDLADTKFTTIGKYMYILNHKGDLPDDIQSRVIPVLEQIVDEEAKKAATAEKERQLDNKEAVSNEVFSESVKVVPTIQDRLKEKARDAAGEVEGWIDEFVTNKKSPVKTVEEFVNLFRTFELKAPHMRFIHMIFDKRAEEIDLAASGKDKDVAEGYSHYSKPELKKFDIFHKNLLKACDMLQEVAKVERAPRKKKPMSHDKLISKLKYKKEDNTLGVVSINPVQIIGSKEVWLYNAKTRKLTQFKALDADGLSVKGASIVSFSPDSAEKTVRKPAETLAEFKKASKVKLRTFLKDLSTVDVTPNGKLNEHHLILRVDK